MIAIRVFSFDGIDCESAPCVASGIKSEAISNAMGESGVFIIDFRPQTCSAFASFNAALMRFHGTADSAVLFAKFLSRNSKSGS